MMREIHVYQETNAPSHDETNTLIEQNLTINFKKLFSQVSGARITTAPPSVDPTKTPDVDSLTPI